MKKNKKRIVVSLGGSTLFKNFKFDHKFARSVLEIVQKYADRGAIITGGGDICRIYSKAIQEIKGSEYDADELCIKITKNNARLVSLLTDNYRYVDTPQEMDKKDRFYITGGFFPGYTTDACSVLVAEKIKADLLINISNIDGIYNKDPKKHKDAKKIKKMSLSEFRELAQKSDKRKAGTHFIFDVMAVGLLNRTRLKEIHFVDKNLENIKSSIMGKKHNGSIIQIK